MASHGKRTSALLLVALFLLSIHKLLLSSEHATDVFVQPVTQQTTSVRAFSRRNLLFGATVGSMAGTWGGLQAAQAAEVCGVNDQKLWNGGLRDEMDGRMKKCLFGIKDSEVEQDKKGCLGLLFSSVKEKKAEGLACLNSCVPKVTGLSGTCSSCYSDLVKCTIDHCAGKCLDSKSEACTTCLGEYCTKCMV
eukprot:TRINITY_DN20132_c1_g1_i2.p1 TRINITY_DN20132_c1_g1~~TRINITY_DN20132_c1_g1_i2.p1  ORF type:complete len:192 (-),score=36.52 TRINITY_DN20132_c1_g1_i2:382-957(-)